MNQFITISLELTARNLEILKQLCEGAPVDLKIKPIDEPHENLAKPIEEHPVENPFPEEKPKLTAADVKAVCLKFSKAGRQSELKAAFAKFGAKKLTEISEDDYPALMEELGNE